MWNLKYDTSETIYETEQIHGHREQPKGRRLGEGWSGKLGLADISYYIQNG